MTRVAQRMLCGFMLLFAAGCCGSPGDPCPDAGAQGGDAAVNGPSPRDFSLVVVNSRAVWLLEEVVSERLRDANEVLLGRDGVGDHACCARLRLNHLRSEPNGPETIDDLEDYEMLRPNESAMGAVVIVSAINWCGGRRDRASGGCTFAGQFPSVLSPRASGLAWAHEFGHAQGHPGLDCSAPDDAGFFELLCEGLSGASIGKQRKVSAGDCEETFLRPRNIEGVISTRVGPACGG